MTGDDKWPERPYKGLSYLGSQDAPLLSGREQDLEACASALGSPNARVLILHGKSGSGKSSFLQAGLLPRIEAASKLLGGSGRSQPPIFARSTHAPLQQLALRLYEFSKQELALGRGGRKISLLDAHQGKTEQEFLAAASDPAFLLGSIAILTRKLPQCLMIVIDQAEEVLTQNGGDDDGRARRNEFFLFLSEYILRNIDARIIVCLRTEYYGWFADEVGLYPSDVGANVRHYFLREFTSKQIEAAILRPTSREPILDYGAPHDRYRFEYEPGLAGRIAEDLLHADTSGGVLLFMQIVCQSLYENTRKTKQQDADWVITLADYEKLGAVSGRITEHISNAILAACNLTEQGSQKQKDAAIEGWYSILCELMQRQDDGTVTTLVKSRQDLQQSASRRNLSNYFDQALQVFCSDDWRLLRRLELSGSNGAVESFSLGHDGVGLVLASWRDAQIERNARKMTARQARWLAVGLAILLAIGLLSIGKEQLLVSEKLQTLERWLNQLPVDNSRSAVLLSIAGIREAEGLWLFPGRAEAMTRQLAWILARLPVDSREADQLLALRGNQVVLQAADTGEYFVYEAGTGRETAQQAPPITGSDGALLTADYLAGSDQLFWIEGQLSEPGQGQAQFQVHYRQQGEWRTVSIEDLLNKVPAERRRKKSSSREIGIGGGYIFIVEADRPLFFSTFIGEPSVVHRFRYSADAQSGPAFTHEATGQIAPGSARRGRLNPSPSRGAYLIINDDTAKGLQRTALSSRLLDWSIHSTFSAFPARKMAVSSDDRYLTPDSPQALPWWARGLTVMTQFDQAEHYAATVIDCRTVILATLTQPQVEVIQRNLPENAKIHIKPSNACGLNVQSLAVSSRGRLALPDTGTIDVWSATTPGSQAVRLLIPPNVQLEELRFAEDDNLLIGVGTGKVVTWDLSKVAQPVLRDREQLIRDACKAVALASPGQVATLKPAEYLPFFGEMKPPCEPLPIPPINKRAGPTLMPR